MDEFIVIVEADADFQIATKLAERVLLEKIEWLESELLSDLFQWNRLLENTRYSCWKDMGKIIEIAKRSGYRSPKFLGHGKEGAIKSDGAVTRKILNLVRFLQRNRQIKAVLLIRDLDNQTERKEGIEKARGEDRDRSPSLAIIIGIADRNREAWVLNGFIASSEETSLLKQIKSELQFDPCVESHRLRSVSKETSDRVRNPKFILDQLTNNNVDREKRCWEETDLAYLRNVGTNTGLTDYLVEIEQRLLPLLQERELSN
jgi:hypothetical protein